MLSTSDWKTLFESNGLDWLRTMTTTHCVLHCKIIHRIKQDSMFDFMKLVTIWNKVSDLLSTCLVYIQ